MIPQKLWVSPLAKFLLASNWKLLCK